MKLARLSGRAFGSLESAETALHMRLLSELGDLPWQTFAGSLVKESRASDSLTVFCLLSVLPFIRNGVEPYTVSPALSEHASYHLLPVLKSVERSITAREGVRLIRLANLAFVGFTEAETPVLNLNDPFQMATAQASVNRDTYRGTRYDFQTAELIGGMQGRFKHWYEANLGISPERAAQLVQDIEKVSYERLLPLLHEGKIAGAHQRRGSWLEPCPTPLK